MSFTQGLNTGAIVSTNELRLVGSERFTQEGTGALTGKAVTFEGSALLNQGEGVLTTRETLTVKAERWVNEGEIRTRDLTGEVSKLTNHKLLHLTGRGDLKATTFHNQSKGRLEGGGTLTLTSERFANEGSVRAPQLQGT